MASPPTDLLSPPDDLTSPGPPRDLVAPPRDLVSAPAASEPGFFGTVGSALIRGGLEGGKESLQAAHPFTDQPPAPEQQDHLGKLLNTPFSQGYSDPKWWGAQIAYGGAKSAPSLALGAAGALVGEAVAPEGVVAGPLVGGAAGFGLGSMIQEIAPAYQRARAQGLDHDSAVDQALTETGIAGAFGAAMGLAPGMSVFGKTMKQVGNDSFMALKRPVSEALAQIFGVQPGLGAAQQVAQGAVEGKMPTPDELATGYASNVGLGVGMTAAHMAKRAVFPERQQAPQDAPPQPPAAPGVQPPIDNAPPPPVTPRGHGPESPLPPATASGEVEATGAVPPAEVPKPPVREQAQQVAQDAPTQAPTDTTKAIDNLVEQAQQEAKAVDKKKDIDKAAGVAEQPKSQKEADAGNYRKGHPSVQGIPITIETPKGAVRRGVGPDGQPWENVSPAHYGYIKKTEGADGDHVDAYVGDHPHSDRAFVVDQIDPATGKFDEHKVILGTRNRDEALNLYFNGFSDGSGPSRLGDITEMPVGTLKQWIKGGDTQTPFAYKEPLPPPPAPPPPEVRPPGTPGADFGTVAGKLKELFAPPRPPVERTQPDLLGGPEVSEATMAMRERARAFVDDELGQLRDKDRAGFETDEEHLQEIRDFLANKTDDDGKTDALTQALLDEVDRRLAPAAKPPMRPEAAPPPAETGQKQRVDEMNRNAFRGSLEKTGFAQWNGADYKIVPVNILGRHGFAVERTERGNRITLGGAGVGGPWSLEHARQRAFEEAFGHGVTAPEPEPTPAPAPQSGNLHGAIIREDQRGLQVHFPAKPPREVLDALKAAGFRWSKVQGLWYAPRTPESEAAANKLRPSPKKDWDAPGTRVELGRAFAEAFRKGGFDNIVGARRLAKEFMGSEPETPTARKTLDEAIEYGATLRAREIVRHGPAIGASPEATFDQLVDLYKRMPVLNERTADSKIRQAYSTPAPVAYLASRLAHVTQDTTVYEPTAGHGMLLIEATPRLTLANELDPERRHALGELIGHNNTTEKDATTSRVDGLFDVVLANPPFGKVSDDKGGTQRFQTPHGVTQEIDHAIALKALEAMHDNGSAVLILGGKKAMGANKEQQLKDHYNSQESRWFFKSLYDDYKVTDHFTISGDLYNRQGAAWPIDIIKIEGRGKSDLPLPGVKPPRILESYAELKDLIHDDAQRRVAPEGKQPGTDSRPGAAGEPNPRGVPGGPRAADTQPDTGRRGQRGQGSDQGVPTPRQRLPEPPAEPMGGGTSGRGRDGEQPRDGGDRQPGVASPGGEPGPRGDQVPPRGGPPGVAPGGGAEGKAAGLTEFDDAFGKALDDVFGPKDLQPPPGAQPEIPKGDQQRPLGEVAGSAVKNTIEGFDRVASGLTKLFGADPTRLGMGPSFDPHTYEQAKVLFKEGLESFGAAARDIGEMVQRMVKMLHEQYQWTREMIERMKPYLKQFLQDVQSGLIKLGDAVSRRRENMEKETKFQTHYKPSSDAEAIGTLVPVNMQSAITRALDGLKSRVGNIDHYVAKKLGYKPEEIVGGTYFSAEQVDAIAMAIDNIERGAGFIIGDQTGVGKGRFGAAMMRYAMQNGKTPIFVTKDPGLYADMYRDIGDIGMKDFKALVTNTDLRGKKRVPLESGEFLESPPEGLHKVAFGQIIKSGRLPDGYHALFTNYSQMQFAGKGAKYQRHDVMKALAPNSVIVLDESHEAGGSETKKIDPDTGKEIPGRADFARELIGDANSAVYASATYAKNPHVMSLYFKTDMSLAVDKIDELKGLIESGGVPLQQAVANMLVEAGQYVRRERSFDGVKMQMHTVKADTQNAENVSSILRNIFELDQHLEVMREIFGESFHGEGGAKGGDNAIGDAGISSTNFSSIMHNVIGQSLLALKTQQAAEHAISAWKAGQKPIIGLSNTFGALLDRYMVEQHLKPGSDLSKLTFNRVFENYLKRTREVTIKDSKGNKTRHYITDDQMKELGFGHLVDAFDTTRKMVKETDLSSMSPSPIDHLLDTMRAAGMKVGEITGRKHVLVKGILSEREASPAAKKRTMNDFNAGKLDALVINRSGSTGFSLHASSKFNDFDANGQKVPAKQRHMVLLQADPNIDTFMQILGRVHRTGQISLPEYSLLVSDLPAEKRPAAVLMRKMASLNANTSANRESAVSLNNVTDFMNQYGDEVVGDLLKDDPSLGDTLGLWPDDDGNYPDGVSAKLTGRLAILPTARQEEVYARLEKNYNDLIETLNRLGRNALEAKTVPLEAKTLEARPITEDKGVDSPFGKPAILEKINAARLGKPYTMDEVKQRIAALHGVDSADRVTHGVARQHMQDMVKALKQEAAPYIEKMNADVENTQQALAAMEKDPEFAQRPDADTVRSKANKRLQLLQDRVEKATKLQTKIADMFNDYRGGQAVNVRVGEGDGAETYHGIIMGVLKSGKAQNPLALSNYVVHVAVADGSQEITVPFSKLGEKGRFSISSASYEDVKKAFEQGMAVGRENREVITGNLLAGFKAMHGHGQLTMFTDHEGNIRQGLLLPRHFSAADALEKLPVIMKPHHALAFMEEAARQGKPTLVKSDDGALTVQRMGADNYLLKAAARDGKAFYLNREVNGILGSKQYAQRRGDKFWSASQVSSDQLGRILKVYSDNLGTHWHVDHDKDLAKSIVEKDKAPLSVPEGEVPPGWNAAEPRGDREEIAPGVYGTVKDKYTQAEQKIVDKVGDILNQMAPRAGVKPYVEMRSGEGAVHGAVVPPRDGLPHVVAWSLEAPKPERVARHEAVHYLKRAGLLSKDEWGTLATAAEKQGWLDAHNIEKRYPTLDHEQQLEEAVADQFAKWRENRRQDTGPIGRLFNKMDLFLRRVAAAARSVLGGKATPDDIFTRIESGEVGRREGADTAKGAALSVPGEEEPEPGTMAHAGSTWQKAVNMATDVGHDLQMAVAPMARGNEMSRAMAKDWASLNRLARFEGTERIKWLTDNLKPEQWKKLFDASEEESLARQRDESTEGIGLARLTPQERVIVEDLQRAKEQAFDQAKRLNMVKSDGIKFHTPRKFVQMVEGVLAKPIGREGSGPTGVDQFGRNLRTTTPHLKERKHETIEESEAAAKAKFGDNTEVVRDIRVLALATMELQQAIAGRALVNHIKRLGDSIGHDTVHEGGLPDHEDERRWFTINDHPAFRTRVPAKFQVDPDTGKIEPVRDKDGYVVTKSVPIHVSKDFEGPLTAILTKKEGAAYKAMMDLKARTMSVIMYSPLIHNAVEWGRALPAMPGKVLTFRAYFEGNRAKNDPAVMREFIRDGNGVPIGQRFGLQDISSILNEPNIAPGRSWTAKLLGAVPGLFDKNAGDAVKRFVDKAGDFWHNTLLWDRVADLQMGLYVNLRDKLIADGFDRKTAVRLAGHEANRFAGALPLESMSQGARQWANFLFFSRSFTFGNLGVMKDAVAGLPRDVQGQILRDAGDLALKKANSAIRRKALAVIGLDMALMYIGNAALQSGIAVMAGNSSPEKEMDGYIRRMQKLATRAKEDPTALLNPLKDITTLMPQGENEPGKEDRVLVGHADDGTAIYMRNPAGKIGEEFMGWLGSPLDMLRRKQGTLARPLYQVFANDAGFGHKLYDPYADTPSAWIANMGRIVSAFMGDQLPMSSITAARDMLAGRGDKKLEAAQLVGPLAGVTFSKGYPGGPVGGLMNRAKQEHDFAVQQAMPSIRRTIQDGNIRAATDQMSKLGIKTATQHAIIWSTQNPSRHLSRAKIAEFRSYAPPEEREEFDRLFREATQ